MRQPKILASSGLESAQVPFGDADEPNILEKAGAEAYQLVIFWIGIDEVTEATHGIVPETCLRVIVDGIQTARELRTHRLETFTKLTAFDHAARDNILRR